MHMPQHDDLHAPMHAAVNSSILADTGGTCVPETDCDVRAGYHPVLMPEAVLIAVMIIAPPGLPPLTDYSAKELSS